MADAHPIFGKAAYDPLSLRAFGAGVFFAMVSLPAVTGAFAGDGMRPETIQATLMRRSLNEGLGGTNIPESYGSQVQMVANHETPTAYFLDKLDGDVDPSKLPATAREVVVAKVRALESPSWVGERHSSGSPPADLPRDVLFIRLKILDVRRGNAAIGEEYNIYFGERRNVMAYPITPDQLTREYMVVMYLDADDAKHRLVGFPISDAQYSEWQAEFLKYQRSQFKP
jgi:hypothetical protein